MILIATGSEVHPCLDAHETFAAEGVRSRVVSLPCWTLFERQSDEYRASVIPPTVRARVCVEQAATFGWERYAGLDGEIVGMTRFGASAPIAELQRGIRVRTREHRGRRSADHGSHHGSHIVKIAIGSDHAGFDLKEHLRAFVESLGHQVVDVGTHSTESVGLSRFRREGGGRDHHRSG